MSVLLKIVYINDIIVPIGAILLNILLLWLIKNVKTKTLIHLNYSLVPNSVIDIFFAVSTFIVAPHVFQAEDNIAIVFGDLFGFFSYTTACQLASIAFSFYLASIISITVSFYIRYLKNILEVAKMLPFFIFYRHIFSIIPKSYFRDYELSIKTMIFPYSILLIISIIHYILFLWVYLPGIDYYNNVKPNAINAFWREEYGKLPVFLINKTTSFSFLSFLGFMFIVFFPASILIAYYSIQISKSLKAHIETTNSNTKLLHKQIQRTLFIQAIGPSLISCFPLSLIVTKSLSNIRSTELSLILSLFFPWISVANPIAALIFIKPYQNRIILMFKMAFKLIHRNYKTSATVAIGNHQ